ncbi:hypothetical protein D9M69_229190 [compost metagenome]
MSGWVSSASTCSRPPWITCSTPFGAPASMNSSASQLGVSGSCSEGLRTKVLPQAMAIGNIHSGIIAGKLNGVIPAHTPRGWIQLAVSMSRATFSTVSPITRLATLAACSTTSMPRQMSPLASAKFLPVSLASSSASSSWCSLSSCW